MFRHSKTNPKDEELDYTPEQHLVSAAAEFKKLETLNQRSIEDVYNTLSSPFKISSMPCEPERLTVLQCYQDIFQRHSLTNSGGAPSSTTTDGSAAPSGQQPMPRPFTQEEVLDLPLHKCVEPALAYKQCVDKGALRKHLASASAFEVRREREASTAAAQMPGLPPA